MPNHRLLAVVALLLASCTGQDASQSPSAPASAAPASLEPTEEATTAATDTAAESSDAAGNELAEILPTNVDGIPIGYEYFTGVEGIPPEAMPIGIQEILDRVGATSEDVTATATVASDGTRVVSIVGLQVRGAEEDTLRSEFRAAMEADGTAFSEEMVAGKDVLAVPTLEGRQGYLYVTGDIMVIVATEPPELAEQVIADLP